MRVHTNAWKLFGSRIGSSSSCLYKSLKCFFGYSSDEGGASTILLRTKWIFRTNFLVSRLQCVITYIHDSVVSRQHSMSTLQTLPFVLLSGIYNFNSSMWARTSTSERIISGGKRHCHLPTVESTNAKVACDAITTETSNWIQEFVHWYFISEYNPNGNVNCPEKCNIFSVDCGNKGSCTCKCDNGWLH